MYGETRSLSHTSEPSPLPLLLPSSSPPPPPPRHHHHPTHTPPPSLLTFLFLVVVIVDVFQVLTQDKFRYSVLWSRTHTFQFFVVLASVNTAEVSAVAVHRRGCSSSLC